jgi:glycosyltransferase involved in cell wall biosynthesis
MGEELETSFEHAKDARSFSLSSGEGETKRSVAMVLNNFSERGGLELYAHKLIEGLVSNGWWVTVFCQRSDSLFSHENLKVEKFATPPSGSPKAQRIAIASENAARQIALQGPFDIVHSQHFLLEGADVVTFHNHTVYRLSDCGLNWERLLNRLKLQLLPAYKMRAHVDQVLCSTSKVLIFPSKICQADFDVHYQISKSHDKRSVMVAHPGATSADIDQEKELAAVPQTPFTFLFVGRGYRKKGLDVLLDAVQILKSKGFSCQLLVAGLRFKPIDKARLKRRGIDKIVSYLGFRTDMDNVYRSAAAIVLPSRVEPFGMAPVEGMLHGLVPIVSKVCGVAETLNNEKDALIFENQLSAKELADCMARLITDQKLVARLRTNALAKAKELDWQKSLSITEMAYQTVLSHQSKHTHAV